MGRGGRKAALSCMVCRGGGNRSNRGGVRFPESLIIQVGTG